MRPHRLLQMGPGSRPAAGVLVFFCRHLLVQIRLWGSITLTIRAVICHRPWLPPLHSPRAHLLLHFSKYSLSQSWVSLLPMLSAHQPLPLLSSMALCHHSSQLTLPFFKAAWPPSLLFSGTPWPNASKPMLASHPTIPFRPATRQMSQGYGGGRRGASVRSCLWVAWTERTCHQETLQKSWKREA